MIIGVRFEDRRRPGEFSPQEYHYKTSLILMPGDKVICPTARGEGRGMVSQVNVPEVDVPERFRATLRRIEKFYEPEPPDAGGDADEPALMPATL